MRTRLNGLVRFILPKRIWHFLRASHRAVVFQRALRKFLRNPEAYTQPDNRVLRNLVYGWGNPFWSAHEEYIASCVAHALNTTDSILECGSGLSTILVGAIAKQRGLLHAVLEDSPEWTKKTQKYLNKYAINSVTIYTNPLKEYADFSWYNPPFTSMPKKFSLVICDGPPSHSTKGGRVGLVPVMMATLAPGCVILLDDTERPQDLAVAKQWEAILETPFQIMGQAKPYAKIIVPNK